MRPLSGYLFVLPALALNVLFFILPSLMTFWISLHDWKPLGAIPFVGLKNYLAVLDDSVSIDAFVFTTRYTLTITPVMLILAMLLALLLNNKLRGVSLARAIYFSPVVISWVAAGVMWRWIFSDLAGVANYFVTTIGLARVNWLGDYAAFSVLLIAVWKGTGYFMVLILAGLQSLPPGLYEAAAIDGAGPTTQFLHITLPLLRPTLALALTVAVIGAYLGFDVWYVVTGGGPAHDTTTIVLWTYRTAFEFFLFGRGAAMSFYLLVFLAAISYIQIRLIRTDVEY